MLGKAHEMFGILTRALSWPGLKVCPQIIYYNTCLMVGGQTLDPDNELTSFIRDALRFISAFIVPISESAPHVYLSALPFSPEHSLVADNFCSKFPNMLKVIEGRPVQWPMTIFTAEHHNNYVECIVFSPDEKTFASISTRAIYICDSETGHRISGPFESEGMYPDQADAYFSHDRKHVLVHCMHHAVVWDIENGKRQLEFSAYNSAFIRDGCYRGKIVSTDRDWVDGRICVKLWDAGKGVLMTDKLFEVFCAGITRFSPDGRFLAMGKRFEKAIELWNVEDGKNVQRFLYSPGYLSSLCFSPTSDSLVATCNSPDHICLWRLDTQEMASINLEVGHIPPAVVHLASTDFLFIPRSRTVEVWEVSMTGSNMIFEIESPMTSEITCICPSRDGHRLLVGGRDGSVSMWSLNTEDLAGDRLVAANTQDDTDRLRIFSFSCSGKIAGTISQSSQVEFRDTTTWEVVGRTYIEYQGGIGIAFSPDDNQVAFRSDSVIAVCDIMEKNFSLKPWPIGRRCIIEELAFQTHDDLVICAGLDNSDAILQVWHLTDLVFDLEFKIPESSLIFLAPDGLTVVIANIFTVSCYSWNHDTAQFDLDPFHFTDEAHLVGYEHAYSPDGKLLACRSQKDGSIRFWDTRTGQLCGRPMPMPGRVDTMALSPALKDQFLGDRIIAVRCSNTISVYDVHSGHLHVQFYIAAITISYPSMSFIQDGTKLALNSIRERTVKIWDLRADYSHAIHENALIVQDMKDGWMMGRNNAPLFWVPSEHRQSLWLPRPRVMVWLSKEKAMRLDLASSRLGNKWTECIDKGWLKALEEKESCWSNRTGMETSFDRRIQFSIHVRF